MGLCVIISVLEGGWLSTKLYSPNCTIQLGINFTKIALGIVCMLLAGSLASSQTRNIANPSVWIAVGAYILPSLAEVGVILYLLRLRPRGSRIYEPSRSQEPSPLLADSERDGREQDDNGPIARAYSKLRAAPLEEAVSSEGSDIQLVSPHPSVPGPELQHVSVVSEAYGIDVLSLILTV